MSPFRLSPVAVGELSPLSALHCLSCSTASTDPLPNYPWGIALESCGASQVSLCLMWALANPGLGAVCLEQPMPLTRALLVFLLQIGDRSGEQTAQLNIAQLRAALGLGPGEEDLAAAHPYSGYEAQGEFLAFWWRWEISGIRWCGKGKAFAKWVGNRNDGAE